MIIKINQIKRIKYKNNFFLPFKKIMNNLIMYNNCIILRQKQYNDKKNLNVKYFEIQNKILTFQE